MPENDFLYSLREDIPDDFKHQLKQQLDAQDQTEAVTKPRHSAWWTVAVASFVTLILSVGILVNNRDTLPFLKPLLPQSELTTSHINHLQHIGAIGGYAYDFATYDDSVIIATTQGIYEHSAKDLNAEPRLLIDDSAYDIAIDSQGNIVYQTIDKVNQKVVAYYWNRETAERRLLSLNIPLSFVVPDSMFISDNGQMIYVAACVLNEPSDVAYIDCVWQLDSYDTDSGEHLATHPLNSTVIKMSQSGDRKWLVYFSYDLPETNLYLNRIDMNTGEIVTLLQTPYNPDYQQWITHSMRLALSGDGQKLLTGHPSTSNVKIWNMDALVQFNEPPDVFQYSGKTSVTKYKDLNETSFSIQDSSDLVFDPSGDFLIQSGDWKWYVYDLRDNVLMAAYRIGANQFRSVDFTDDGTIAFGMYEGILYSYDVETWEEREVLTRYANLGDTLSFTQDGKWLMTNGTPILWDLSTDTPTAKLLHHFLNRVHKLRHAVISPDGQYVAYQPYDSSPLSYGRVFVQNLSTQQPYQVGKLVAPMTYMKFLADNTLLIVSEYGAIYRIPPEKLEVEEEAPYSITQIDDVKLRDVSSPAYVKVKFSPDGQLAALWDCQNYDVQDRECEKTSLHLWDVTNQQSIIKIEDPTFKEQGYIDFSADGQQLAISFCTELEVVNKYDHNECVSSESHIYSVEQLRTGNNIKPFAIFQTESSTALAYHPIQQDDDSYILALTIVGKDGGTQFWQVTTDGLMDDALPLAYHPIQQDDGSYKLGITVLSGDVEEQYEQNINNPQVELMFIEPEIQMPITFSPTGNMLVTRGLDMWRFGN